ncbi:1,4-dihydroxy-2-naphthoate polyprenyltransferase [Agrococcus jejuensis]|uniref:1,4-dihydroxy-2-naphthoate polyprenyltransferase n=1 Tax=Agrococcus jejuensis TaxID=399736 RepID=UPI0021B52908|nr:1,4-dihydroxy-2-naphthoate polyprenyltransferase [Agrococcus jejuensis]
MAKTSAAPGGRKQDERARARSGNPARRGTTVRAAKRPPTFGDWVAATRPRTMSMAIAPVAVGVGAAFAAQGYHLGIALLALAVAVFLQMGVNVANDYSDGIRGTDVDRKGPRRITSSTAVDPKQVRTVAIVLLGLGAAAGVALAVVSQQWGLLLVGAVCVALAWLYTGGPRPYGYYGLGELVAFLVFGMIAVNGTVFATLGRWTEDSLVLGAAMGCFAAALMLVNNLRDLDSDRAAGKRTVPTLIGRVASKVLYGILMLVPFGILAIYSLALAYGPFVLLVLVVAVPSIVIVAMGRTTRDFVTALGLTSLTTLLYGLGIAVALWGGITGFAF